MKNGITVLILAAIAISVLVGCKKKTEPAPAAKMEMPQTAKQAADQAKQTAEQAAADVQKKAETVVATVTEQTKCPVLPNNPIDKNVFVEYKGKKVYFCCENCKAEFNKEPEKYIKDLPQFKQ
jgi:YHS domain-containing protein